MSPPHPLASLPTLSVLHVVRPAEGGIARHVALLCRGLPAAGIEIAVAAPASIPPDELGGYRADPGAAHLATARGSTAAAAFPVYSVPIAARLHPSRDIAAARAVARLTRDMDLLHGHGLRGAWIACLATIKTRKPFIFTAHNLAPTPSGLSRLVFGAAARRAAQAICVSQSVAGSLAPYGLTRERTCVIPNGIELAPFDRRIDRNAVLAGLGVTTPLLVAAVGRLAPEKGFDVLARAAADVLAARQDVAFVLAGDGPQRAVLERQAQAAGLGGRFVFAGRLPDAAALLAAADVVAVPSRSEGQGIVALEAMAARRPVAASRVGGLAETVDDGVTGRLVPVDDAPALAAALMELLRDDAARERMGAAGRRLVERGFTVERMVQRTHGVYEDIMRR